ENIMPQNLTNLRICLIAASAFVVSGLAATGCGSILDVKTVQLRLQGAVTSPDGSALAGARVSLERSAFVFQGSVAEDITDANGRYSIEYSAACEDKSDLNIAPGNALMLVVYHANFETVSSINVGATLRCTGSVQTVDFRVRPPFVPPAAGHPNSEKESTD
ncbi:MAG: carboxypeptidase-like regulatory domain-containing protein, partial [Longimicrobiales bacterium]